VVKIFKNFRYFPSMKILIAFDSFKGSLDSAQAGNILAEVFSTYPTEVLTVADGGEGSLQVLDLPSRPFTAVDPWGVPLKAYYKYQGDTAYFELALTCGLTLIQKRNPLLTHTEGLGMGLRQAIVDGCKRIVIFAGGSATHDAGTGALYALGFRYFDTHGKPLRPRGENLGQIIDFIPPALTQGIHFTIATDVTNPFTGPQGATYTYAPQKGATPEDLPQLEAGLVHLENCFTKRPLPPGSGAAGGLAGGFHMFLGADILPATDLLLLDVKEKVEKADVVITGEGSIDEQTLSGKLVSKILEMSKDKKFALLAGQLKTPLYQPQILWQEGLTDEKIDTEYAMKNAALLLKSKGEKLREFLENYRSSNNINA
jgi:glycerate kinase